MNVKPLTPPCTYGHGAGDENSNENALGLQGKEGRYDYEINNEGDVIVTDKQTGETFVAKKCKQKKNSVNRSWSFIDSKGKKHYVTEKVLETADLRRQIENTPLELMNKRNNVEAAMFQYSFHTRNGKTRSRTLFKHELHAYARCMWMNFRRYLTYINKLQCQGTLEGAMAL